MRLLAVLVDLVFWVVGVCPLFSKTSFLRWLPLPNAIREDAGGTALGPIFRNANGKPLSLGSVVNRVILPTLNRCETCHKAQGKCDRKTAHEYKRDAAFPEWHGWHAARRGLGSNLNRLGVDDSAIQRILRHSNISTTQAYYIKTAADDVRNAMSKLENNIPETAPALTDIYGTLKLAKQATDETIQ